MIDLFEMKVLKSLNHLFLLSLSFAYEIRNSKCKILNSSEILCRGSSGSIYFNTRIRNKKSL